MSDFEQLLFPDFFPKLSPLVRQRRVMVSSFLKHFASSAQSAQSEARERIRRSPANSTATTTSLDIGNLLSRVWPGFSSGMLKRYWELSGQKELTNEEASEILLEDFFRFSLMFGVHPNILVGISPPNDISLGSWTYSIETRVHERRLENYKLVFHYVLSLAQVHIDPVYLYEEEGLVFSRVAEEKECLTLFDFLTVCKFLDITFNELFPFTKVSYDAHHNNYPSFKRYFKQKFPPLPEPSLFLQNVDTVVDFPKNVSETTTEEQFMTTAEHKRFVHECYQRLRDNLQRLFTLRGEEYQSHVNGLSGSGVSRVLNYKRLGALSSSPVSLQRLLEICTVVGYTPQELLLCDASNFPEKPHYQFSFSASAKSDAGSMVQVFSAMFQQYFKDLLATQSVGKDSFAWRLCHHIPSSLPLNYVLAFCYEPPKYLRVDSQASLDCFDFSAALTPAFCRQYHLKALERKLSSLPLVKEEENPLLTLVNESQVVTETSPEELPTPKPLPPLTSSQPPSLGQQPLSTSVSEIDAHAHAYRVLHSLASGTVPPVLVFTLDKPNSDTEKLFHELVGDGAMGITPELSLFVSPFHKEACGIIDPVRENLLPLCQTLKAMNPVIFQQASWMVLQQQLETK